METVIFGLTVRVGARGEKYKPPLGAWSAGRAGPYADQGRQLVAGDGHSQTNVLKDGSGRVCVRACVRALFFFLFVTL